MAANTTNVTLDPQLGSLAPKPDKIKHNKNVLEFLDRGTFCLSTV